MLAGLNEPSKLVRSPHTTVCSPRPPRSLIAMVLGRVADREAVRDRAGEDPIPWMMIVPEARRSRWRASCREIQRRHFRAELRQRRPAGRHDVDDGAEVDEAAPHCSTKVSEPGCV